MRRRCLLSAFLAILGLSGCDWLGLLFPPEDASIDEADRVVVNLQIDAENEDVEGLADLMDAVWERNLAATVFVTADYANRQQLTIWQLYQGGFEIALHGYYTGEQLATMTAAEQEDLLGRAKTAVEGCQPCGTYKPVSGFRPQYFSQNEDTYDLLDAMGVEYNCGFKAGQIYAEGHENDVTPYPVEGHSFYAVPITTFAIEDRTVYLCDIACAYNEGMTGQDWSDLLDGAFDQAKARGTPLVVIFHGWYSGDAETGYLQPFTDFLDRVQREGRSVTTADLVDMYR